VLDHRPVAGGSGIHRNRCERRRSGRGTGPGANWHIAQAPCHGR